MANVTETNVELEADGKPIFAAMDLISGKIKTIQKELDGIIAAANKGTDGIDRKLSNKVSELQAALGQMRSLSKFAEDAGKGKGPIVAINAEKAFGNATLKAAQFTKTIEQASNAAEALNARMNKVDKGLARFGKMGVTSGPAFEKLENQRKNLTAQLELYKKISTAQESLERRAGRTQGLDPMVLKAERDRLAAAKLALEEKMMNPRSRNVTNENAAALQAVKAYETALDAVRDKKAAILKLDRDAVKAERDRIKTMSDYDKAMLEAAKKREAQMKEMWAAEDARKLKGTYKDPNPTTRAPDLTAKQTALHEGELARIAALKKADADRLKAQQAAAETKRKADEATMERLRKINIMEEKTWIAQKNAAAVASGNGQQRREQIEAKILSYQERSSRLLGEDKAKLLELVQLEQKRLANLESQIRAEERRIAAAARAAAPTSHSILPSGGFGTVIARTAAYAAAGSGIFAVVGALQQGFSFAVEFEDALAKLAAVAGATDGQMVDLTESIIDVGRQSKFSLSELAEGATMLAQAGFATKEIQDSLMAVQTLAAASGSSLSQAVDLTTSAISAFSLSTTDATRLSDELVSALNRSKLTVGDVASAIQTAGSTAATMNISFEELTSTIGSMTQAGVRGQMASTGLRQFLIDLKNPSKDLSAELTKLGLTFADVDIATRGLPAVLQTLSSSGFGATEAFASLENRSAAAYLTMIRQIPLQQELALAMNDTGAATEAAAKATNSFSAQWEILKNNLGAGVSAIFDDLKLKEALKGLNDYYDRVAFIAQWQKDHGITDAHAMTTSQREQMAAAIRQYESAAEASSNYAEKLDKVNTKAKESSEAFSGQQQKLNSLEEAINRLVARQSSLKDNSTALSIETGNMSNQFQGLALHLDVTKNSFESLLNAAQAYRVEQLKILEDNANIASLDLRQAARTNQRGASQAIARVNANMASRGQTLDPGIQALIDRAARPGSDNFDTRMNVLAQISARAAAIKDDPTLKQLLNEVVTSIKAMNSNVRSAQRIELTGNAARIAQRADWVAVQKKADGLTNSEKDKPAREAMISKLQDNINNRKYTYEARQVAEAVIAGLEAKSTSTGSFTTDTAGAASAARSADRKATDSAAMKRLLEDPRIGARVTATKDDHNKYVAGTNRISDHYMDKAIDFVPKGGMGSMTKDQVRKMIENLGVKIRTNGQGVEQLFGPGDKGHNNHWHVAWEGSAPSGDALDKADTANSQLALNTAEKDLKEKLKERKQADSIFTFEQLSKSAEESFAAWEAAYKKLNEDQSQDFTPTQKDERDLQVKEAIAQKREEFRDKMLDDLINMTEASIDIVSKEFERALQPRQVAIAKLQGQLQGFDLASNQGRVPDYVKTLTSQKLAKETEARDRDRLAQLSGSNGQIDQTQYSLNALNEKLNSGAFTGEELNTKIADVEKLTDKLEALRLERDQLEQVFGAQGLIPQSFSEGFNQAIAAIKGASDFGMSFSQQMTQGIGGALDQVREGFGTFFSDILTGSQTVLGAFGNFAKGIISYIEQMVAKALATQLFNFLIGLVGPSVASTPVAADNSFSGGFSNFGIGGNYTGGLIGRARGGPINQGTAARDSVLTKLAKGEYVVQKSAVDSVGTSFMENLNRNGSMALKDMKSMPQLIAPQAKQEMKVFVVAPGSKPQMSPSDVLLVIQDDMLKGGTTKQLIRHISQGG